MARTTIGGGRGHGHGSGNVSPVAVITGDAEGTVDVNYVVDMRNSSDSDGTIKSWSVLWGDGDHTEGRRQPTTTGHFYTEAGTYTITLTVNDGTASAQDTLAVTITAADVSIPQAPQSLSAVSTSATAVTVTWVNPNLDSTTVSLERKTGSGAYAGIGSPVAFGTTTYADSGLVGGTTYTYRAYCTNSAGTSAYSNEASVTTQPTTDSVPDPFTFASQTGVEVSTAINSAPATLSGLNTTVAITVSGGKYSIDGGSYVTTAGTVVNGSIIRAQVTSSASASTAATVTITVGGVVGTFTATTAAAQPLDITPDPFSFASTTGAATATVTICATTVTIAGINAAAAISIANASGQYSKNGGAYTGSAGTVISGDTVNVKCTSSASAGTAVTTTLTVGTYSANFTVTTAPAAVDTLPDDFNIAAQTNVPISTACTSAPITMTGLTSPANISISGNSGTYNKNGGSFTASSGTVAAADVVRVKQTSSSSYSTTLITTLTVDVLVKPFAVTTTAAPPSPAVPTAPSGLAAVISQTDTVFLSWTDNSTNEDGFKIERKVSGGSYAQIATLASNAVYYFDYGLTPGTTYVYRMRAYNSVGNSSYTSEVTIQNPVVTGVIGKFVDGTNGSNGNAGTQASPWQTIAYGKTQIHAGDTLWVRTGSYNERISSLPSGTSWTNKVRIAAYPGETVTLAPTTNSGVVLLELSNNESYIEWDGIHITAPTHHSGSVTFFHAGTHHVRLRNCAITNGDTPGFNGALGIDINSTDNEFINLTVTGLGGPYGFYLSGNRNLIDGCTMTAVSGAGIHVYASGGTPTDNIIRNCLIHDIDSYEFFGVPDDRRWGVLIAGNGNQLYNTVIYNITTSGSDDNVSVIGCFGGSGTKVWNNTVANNDGYGIKVDGTSGAVIQNNISYNNTTSNYSNSGSNTTENHNSRTGTNPVFVSSSDFHLTGSTPGSILNSGVAVSTVLTDNDDVLRADPPDIGAYEYVP